MRARGITVTGTRNKVADIGTFTPRRGFSHIMLNTALITRAIRALAALLSLETRAALLSRASHSSILYGV